MVSQCISPKLWCNENNIASTFIKVIIYGGSKIYSGVQRQNTYDSYQCYFGDNILLNFSLTTDKHLRTTFNRSKYRNTNLSKRISKILHRRKIVLIRHKLGDPAISFVTFPESNHFIGHFLFLWRINTILWLGKIFDISDIIPHIILLIHLLSQWSIFFCTDFVWHDSYRMQVST
jgi:hypothetical protein